MVEKRGRWQYETHRRALLNMLGSLPYERICDLPLRDRQLPLLGPFLCPRRRPSCSRPRRVADDEVELLRELQSWVEEVRDENVVPVFIGGALGAVTDQARECLATRLKVADHSGRQLVEEGEIETE